MKKYIIIPCLIICILAIITMIIIINKSENSSIHSDLTDNFETDKPETESNDMKKTFTKDELLQYINVSEEDVQYIDVDDFISLYTALYGDLHQFSPEALKETLFKRNDYFRNIIETTHLYLLDSEKNSSIEKFDIANCEHIGVYSWYEVYGKSFLIDVSQNKLFYSEKGNVLSNTETATKTIELTPEILNDIEEQISNTKFEKLKQQDDSVSNLGWQLVIECGDDIIRYTTHTKSGDSRTLVDLVNSLLDYVEGLE